MPARGKLGDDDAMTWIAPDVDRLPAPYLADEATMLADWLDWHRATLLSKCSGLTAERLAVRAVPPSGLSLLGLVRHLAEVERAWFRRRFAGEDVPYLFSDEDNPDGEFDDADPATAAADLAVLRREIELARAAVAGRSLDETFWHSHRAAEISLRWVFVHMIEEYARHNGHADLLREHLDGSTGL
jgi:uncharacterized damage-inducible protein DinB